MKRVANPEPTLGESVELLHAAVQEARPLKAVICVWEYAGDAGIKFIAEDIEHMFISPRIYDMVCQEVAANTKFFVEGNFPPQIWGVPIVILADDAAEKTKYLKRLGKAIAGEPQ